MRHSSLCQLRGFPLPIARRRAARFALSRLDGSSPASLMASSVRCGNREMSLLVSHSGATAALLSSARCSSSLSTGEDKDTSEEHSTTKSPATENNSQSTERQANSTASPAESTQTLERSMGEVTREESEEIALEPTDRDSFAEEDDDDNAAEDEVKDTHANAEASDADKSQQRQPEEKKEEDGEEKEAPASEDAYEYDEEEEELAPGPESIAPKSDKERRQQHKKQLRRAEASLQFKELLSPENIHKYIHLTEVSTPSGVRWLDVTARPALWENRLLARQSETDFVACVVRTLRKGNLSADAYAAISGSGALPNVSVRERWLHFTLRAIKNPLARSDPYDTALGMSALLAATARASAGPNTIHGSDSDAGEAAEDRSGEGAAAADPIAQNKARLAERLYAESAAQRARTAASELRASFSPFSSPSSSHKKVNGDGNEAASESSSSAPLPPPPPPPLRRPGGGDPILDDPASRYYYDEDTNQFLPIDGRRGTGGPNLGWRSWLLPWRAARARDAAHMAAHKRRRDHRKLSGGFFRGKVTDRSLLKAPTLTQETERLSMFLIKEVHPLDCERKGGALSEARVQSVPRIGYIELDEYGNELFSFGSGNGTTSNVQAATSAPPPPPRKKEVILEEDNEGKKKESSVGKESKKLDLHPIRDTNRTPQEQLRLRWLLLTVHREPLSFVQETLIRWQEFIANGGRLRTEEEAVSHGGGDPFNRAQLPFLTKRDVGWEDIVRHLFHETVRGLQRASVAQTRALDTVETDVFDDSTGSAERMQRMRSMLGDLHQLSRRASMHTDILKESKIAYEKLKKTVDSPLSATDRKSLSFLNSAISLSHSIEEQSASLLFLQFSVAMNEMEVHLRTLTVFSTFFTPLSFIVSYYSMQLEPLETHAIEGNGIYTFILVLAMTAAVTARWILVNLK